MLFYHLSGGKETPQTNFKPEVIYSGSHNLAFAIWQPPQNQIILIKVHVIALHCICELLRSIIMAQIQMSCLGTHKYLTVCAPF